MSTRSLLIGHERTEGVNFTFPDAMANPEGWYEARADIRVHGFEGAVEFFFRADDLVVFAEQLRTLYESLSGSAIFDTDEGQVRLELRGNARGGIAVSGTAVARGTHENRLNFAFELDQTFLAAPAIVALELASAYQRKGVSGSEGRS